MALVSSQQALHLLHSGAELAYLTTTNAVSSLFVALQVWLWGHTWVRQVGQRPAQALPECCQGIMYADDSNLYMLASQLPHARPAQPPSLWRQSLRPCWPARSIALH